MPNKPIIFACPSCGAKYIIVTTEEPDGVQRKKFGCANCSASFPAVEGQIALKYIPLDSDADD